MKERKTTEEMQLVDIDKLIPYINNARTHSKRFLMYSEGLEAR